jgi:hypothetical protein
MALPDHRVQLGQDRAPIACHGALLSFGVPELLIDIFEDAANLIVPQMGGFAHAKRFKVRRA